MFSYGTTRNHNAVRGLNLLAKCQTKHKLIIMNVIYKGFKVRCLMLDNWDHLGKKVTLQHNKRLAINETVPNDF